MTKKLLVEAEGVKREYSTSIFFCPKEHTNSTFSDTIQLDLLEQVVPGSVHAELEFVGELYKNIDLSQDDQNLTSRKLHNFVPFWEGAR